MINIDKKDRKLLYYLSKDSRITLKILGKKVGISREMTAYRIQRLIENKIITKFTTNINIDKLGYSGTNVFFNFKNINPTIKKDIIEHAVNNKLTTYVSLLEGAYDFQIEYILGDPFEFEAYYDKMQEKYHNYMTMQYSVSFIRAEEYSFPFLIDKNKNQTQPRYFCWGGSIVNIDDLDFDILKELASNSRMKIKNIANNVNSSISIVNNRIKKLIQHGVITNFTVNIDWSKLGYNWYHLQICLNEFGKKNQILQYLRESPQIVRILKGFFFNIDIHATFLFKDDNQFRELVEGATSQFPNSIANYQFYRTFKLFKHEYMIPKLIKNKNPWSRASID